MNDPLRTCTLVTFEGSRDVTSLQEFPYGTTPSLWPDGPQIVKSGRGARLASLSARQARELGLLMSGTCGRPSITSSESAALQECLESRLQAAARTLGSTLYKTTWKPWTMPSGRLRLRQRASVLSIAESARTGLPTPGSSVVDAKPRPPVIGNRKATDPQIGLADIAVWLVWPAQLLTGSYAPMVGRARLNPDYARWLMNIPAAWKSCAPTETRLTPARPRRSSKP